MGLGKSFPNCIQRARIGRGIGPARPTDRGLVNDDDVVAVGESHRQQRGFAGAGHPGHRGEDPGGDIDRNIGEIMLGDVADGQLPGGFPEYCLQLGAVF